MEFLKRSIPLRLRLKFHTLRRTCWNLNLTSYPAAKFFIYGTGRSGSTLLSNLLNSHPDIFCDGEILGKRYAPDVPFPYFYISALTKRAILKGKNVYGCKLKTDQLRDQKYLKGGKFMKKLVEDGWKIIHLRRNNVVNIALSHLQARKDQVWVLNKQSNYTSLKIKVNTNDLIHLIHSKEELHAIEDECLQGIPHFRIDYERDLLDNQWTNTMKRVFEYLEINDRDVTTSLKKKSNERIVDRIENAEEVIRFLKQEGYSHLTSSNS